MNTWTRTNSTTAENLSLALHMPLLVFMAPILSPANRF